MKNSRLFDFRIKKYFPGFCSALLLAAGLFGGFTRGQEVLRVPMTDHVSRGIDAAMHGRVDEATRLFREATDETPDMYPPGLTVAAILAQAPYSDGQFTRVRFWIEKTAEDYPEDPEAFLLLAEFAVREKRLVEATLLLRHVEQLIAKMDAAPSVEKTATPSPESPVTEIVNETGTKTPVEPVGVRKKRLSARVGLQWVAIAESRKDWAGAAELLEAMIAERPEDPDLNFRLGRDQFKSGQREKGIATLYRASRSGDRDKDAASGTAPGDQGVRDDEMLALITSLYEQEGLFDEARDFLDRSLEQEPDNARLLLQAADMNIRWNRLDKARSLADRAAELAPNDILVRRTRGILALYAREYSQAEDLLSLVHDLHPGDAATTSALVACLCEQDDPLKLRKAQNMAVKYFRERPELMDAAATLAMVYLWRGENVLARRLLEAKFEEDQLGAAGAFFMAVILERDGQSDDALHFLRSCLETKTNFPQRTEAENMLKRLEEQKQANPEAD